MNCPKCRTNVGCGCNLVSYLGERMCKNCLQVKVAEEQQPQSLPQQITPDTPANNIIQETPVSNTVSANVTKHKT